MAMTSAPGKGKMLSLLEQLAAATYLAENDESIRLLTNVLLEAKAVKKSSSTCTIQRRHQNSINGMIEHSWAWNCSDFFAGVSTGSNRIAGRRLCYH
ncbi:hypothetical protein SERLA73DRAFT_170015 [Serpula lacrymans var. lacrymans S7.3]|uniref:Uncharacterized protein n=2 Tax=Serpula lacrymans var. lacrymans TaxID=341189 RepID=F8Q4S2_SERL3|nr:uncharacterized protein SERLADRAFT_472418 [Serpula lacrymans var. lacrymans S7.9]EGN96549.1 hypothetical protein SERLA73DRAFT_170015 [Serpula lacrymans var. lacrymans S7.3]EGO22091.1 hypothetical protein SERLADRAFT_472418 [Serpula lacrymans var. lacrymans S7.9]